MADERIWVRRLKRRFPAGGAVRTGIGDDAAVIRMPGEKDWVITTDQMVEGAHFLRRRQPARSVGWKALARSLSDIAAMRAKPRYALVALTVPARLDPCWIEQFYSGLGALAKRFKVQVIGGDFATGPTVAADVQVIGEVERGRALLRSGARPGQVIYVTGTLGLSALGEELTRRPTLSRTLRGLAKAVAAKAQRAHFYPEARVVLARKLPRTASALMDLSDGLSLDLHRLCEASRVGARLFRDKIPCFALPSKLEGRLKTSALDLALHGGEDYELLFTAPRSARIPKNIAGIAVTRIGETTKSRSILLCDSEGDRKGTKLTPGGWDHFVRAKKKSKKGRRQPTMLVSRK